VAQGLLYLVGVLFFSIGIELMHISVLTLSGDQFELGCEPDDTVRCLKQKLADRENAEAPEGQASERRPAFIHSFSVIFNGQNLDDKMRLREANIKHGVAVHVIYRKTMAITMKDLCEDDCKILCEPDETVQSFSERIARMQGKGKCQLVFNGSQLRKDALLSECGIHEGAIVHDIAGWREVGRHRHPAQAQQPLVHPDPGLDIDRQTRRTCSGLTYLAVALSLLAVSFGGLCALLAVLAGPALLTALAVLAVLAVAAVDSKFSKFLWYALGCKEPGSPGNW